MNSFKKRCIELRKDDYTLSEIARITRRAKTSVYEHIRDIPLSAEKLEQIRHASGTRFAELGRARKGKSVRSFKRISHWTPRSVFLVAHLLFDGEIRRTTCAYNNRSGALIRKVAETMHDVYVFEPKRYRNPITGVARISYHNVALGAYMQKKSAELLARITVMPRSFKREFLRAFFDDEGCMDFRPGLSRRSVRGYQKNREILELVQALLADFDIRSEIKKPNEVVIVGREHLRLFQSEIGFSPGVRVNGNRPNSIWRKHLEKRNLLKRALASFKA